MDFIDHKDVLIQLVLINFFVKNSSYLNFNFSCIGTWMRPVDIKIKHSVTRQIFAKAPSRVKNKMMLKINSTNITGNTIEVILLTYSEWNDVKLCLLTFKNIG